MSKKKKGDSLATPLDLMKAEPLAPKPMFHGVITSPVDSTRGSILTHVNTPGQRFHSRVQWLAYRKSRYLATVVDLIANAAAKKWHLERKDGAANDPQEVQLIESFLNAPNPNDNFSSLCQNIFIDWLIHGCCLVEFHTSNVDKPALESIGKALDMYPELQSEIADTVGAIPEPGFPSYFAVLPFDQMEIIVSNAGQVIKYQQFTVNGDTIDFDPSEVMKMLHPKSRDKVYGDSPLDPILKTITMDNQIVDRQLKTLQTDILADRLFILKEGRTEEEAQAFHQELVQKYRASGIESPVIVVSSDIEYQDISQGGKDGEYLTLSENIRNIIAMRYGVPLSVLGDTSGTSSTYSAGSDTAYRIFVEQAVRPLAQHLEQLLNRHLLSHFGAIGLQYMIRFDILDGDDTAEAEKMYDMMLRNGSTTINEVRGARGKQQPIPGGDINMVYTATAAMPVADLAKGSAIPVPAPTASEQPQDVVDKKQDKAIAKAQAALRDLRKAWIS